MANIKEPLIVCYKDLIKGRVMKCYATEVMTIPNGDLECRDKRDKVIATFHHDCLEWVQARVQ